MAGRRWRGVAREEVQPQMNGTNADQDPGTEATETVLEMRRGVAGSTTPHRRGGLRRDTAPGGLDVMDWRKPSLTISPPRVPVSSGFRRAYS